MSTKHLLLLLMLGKFLPMAYPPARKKVLGLALRVVSAFARRR